MLLHISFWLVSDTIVWYLSYHANPHGITWSQTPGFLCCWVLSQLLVVPVYVYGVCGDTVVWRDKRYKLRWDGSVALVKKAEGNERAVGGGGGGVQMKEVVVGP
jgi:ceramide glucosyltransferase